MECEIDKRIKVETEKQIEIENELEKLKIEYINMNKGGNIRECKNERTRRNVKRRELLKKNLIETVDKIMKLTIKKSEYIKEKRE